MRTFKITFYHRALLAILLCLVTSQTSAQEKVIKLPFSTFDRWIVRDLHESAIIGGNNKRIYAIGRPDTLVGNNPLHPAKDAVWGTSNVYAKVSGVVKGSCSVFPEKRGDGYCVRMETVMEQVTAIGIINLKVIATGSIFLGHLLEPVRDTKNPMAKLMLGIPFTQRPTALRFDYKTKTGGKLQKASGLGAPTNLEGHNNSEVFVLLQKRWEDKEGNIYAKRIGTGWVSFDKSQPEWVNDFTLPITYGDITKKSYYKPYMNLISGEGTYYCLNSKGKAVPIQEIEWGDADETPTHIIIRCQSGNGGAYIGAVGDVLWIDNVELLME